MRRTKRQRGRRIVLTISFRAAWQRDLQQGHRPIGGCCWKPRIGSAWRSCENLSAPVWLDAPPRTGPKDRVVTGEVRGSRAVARGVGLFGEVLHEREECRRLADEEPHIGEKL